MTNQLCCVTCGRYNMCLDDSPEKGICMWAFNQGRFTETTVTVADCVKDADSKCMYWVDRITYPLT